ncbi:hypothetical protein TWF481_003810 [Arthrobotrys musiformis]|uniref:3'-5' exonuclease domain-containing protein n=1 Tax=Arthrobotrys musiformis TaxID=47236 RepID=A0AAV9WI64_9PEZI
MSRRLPTLQVRAATTSIGRPAARCCFHSIIMEDQTIVGSSGSSSSAGAGASGTGATVGTTTNTPTKMAPPLSTAYQPPSAAIQNPTTAASSSSPITPITPSNAHRMWSPSRGIIFAPSPITPVSPFTTTRSFKTKSPSKSSLDNAPATPSSTSSSADMMESPTIRRTQRSGFRHKPDWAGLMNLTRDGKEKETVPAGFDTFQGDILADSPGGPLSDVKALRDAVGALAEEIEGDTSALTMEGEEGEEEIEDPGIERVRTPEGEEIIQWKGKPIVYTDETDPYVPSLYQAGEDVITAAVEASGDFDMNHYINSEGNAPKIHYVTDVDDMEVVSKLFENDKAIGFDMEWVPNSILRPTASGADIRNCASVIQIANQERVAIFHLARFPANTKKFLSETLKKILEDSEIVKMGVAIKADMSRLSTMINVSPAGILELGHFHSLVFAAEGNVPARGKRLPTSLTDLCKEHLKLPLNKGDVRTSNWSLLLSEEQKIYAANDAYAGLKIYEALEERRCALVPRPALPPLQSLNHEQTIELYHKRRAILAAKKDDGTPKKPSVIRVPKDAGPQLVQAYDWVKEYARSKSDGVLATGAANLRCYALWHHQNLDVEDTAVACRDPPLGSAYVAQCILEAVLVEKLPYNPGRLLWVMRELSKEASGRYYPLKMEANTKVKEHHEQVAQAKAGAAAAAAAKAQARLSREHTGWNMDGAGVKPRHSRENMGWNLEDSEASAAKKVDRKRGKTDPDGPPQIRYHVAADQPGREVDEDSHDSDGTDAQTGRQPRKLIRQTIRGSNELIYPLPREDRDPDAPPVLRRGYSGPPKLSYKHRTIDDSGPKVSFYPSGELGDLADAFGKSKVREVEDDDDDAATMSLRRSESEPNLVPKRPVWIGVPSRRRREDL